MAIDTIKSTAVLDGAISTADLANDIAINTSGAITTTGAFTSKGIDDNADATALTIDSSESVLVGKTSAGAASTGFESRSSGYTAITRDGGQPLEVRRLTSDGVLIDLRKDGTTVGSIASGDSGNEFKWYGTFASGAGLGAYSNVSIRPLSNTGAAADGTVNLGHSSQRFKDAYLSGGVYLGGTGSANKLEDYEEGSWTPSLYAPTGGALTVSGSASGRYTKIGRLVHLSFAIGPFTLSGGTSGAAINIAGVPFTTQGSGLDSNGSVLGIYNISWSRTDFVALRTYDVSTLGFLVSNNGGGWIWETVSAFTGSNKYINGTITYMTTA
jgi:hypothetical protein